MRIVSIWNPKGGQGKTTISMNLAAAAAKLGLKVMVVSKDIQDDAKEQYGRGTFTFDVVQNLPVDEKPDADLVILDYPAGHREAPDSYLVIVPIVPCRIDYDTYVKAKPALEGKRIIEVCSRGDVRVAAEKEFILAMRKKGASVIRRRSAFSNAHNEKTTIFDYSLNKVGKIGELRAEVEALLSRVLGDG